MKLAIKDWTGNPQVASTWTEGTMQRFALVGRSAVISAQISGAFLDIFPERSAEHKVLLVALTEPGE